LWRTHSMNQPNWKTAVRNAMREKASQQEKRKKGDAAFSYRWEHVHAVVKVANKLAALTGADADVIEAAAWLHDICKEAKDRHPQEGAKFARRFLPTTDFPIDKVHNVALAIEDHMGLWRDEPLRSLESQVLWDADKLTKIGITAAVHWMGGDFTRRRLASTEALIARLQSADWRHKTVASMHTAPAKRAAQSRFEAYDQMLAQLSAEWDAQDIV
ncbi:MAG: HD domain-containing protein, partial [Candidatus Promineifilaceae bacterium]